MSTSVNIIKIIDLILLLLNIEMDQYNTIIIISEKKTRIDV